MASLGREIRSRGPSVTCLAAWVVVLACVGGPSDGIDPRSSIPAAMPSVSGSHPCQLPHADPLVVPPLAELDTEVEDGDPSDSSSGAWTTPNVLRSSGLPARGAGRRGGAWALPVPTVNSPDLNRLCRRLL